MQVVYSDQVKYCKVVHQVAGQSETRIGLIYKRKLFIRIKSYGKAQGQEAIQDGRKAFLEKKAQVLFLVVKEPKSFSLWVENNQVKIANNQTSKVDVAANINLEQLVAKMRNIGGIQIRDRRYKLKVYPRCFVGSEAVKWLRNHLQISQKEAIAIGNKLMADKWIHHVVDEHPFEDGDLFYRFYWDE